MTDMESRYDEWIVEIDPEIRINVDAHILQSIFRYAFFGVPVGDFLQAVIANNLREAMGRADHHNKRVMHEIVRVFYNYCPGDCWGKPDAYKVWLEARKETGPFRGMPF